MFAGVMLFGCIAGIILGACGHSFFDEQDVGEKSFNGYTVESCIINMTGYANCSMCWDCLSGTCNAYTYKLVSPTRNISNSWSSPCGCGEYPDETKCFYENSRLVFYGMRPSRKTAILIMVIVGSCCIGFMSGTIMWGLTSNWCKQQCKQKKETEPISMTVQRNDQITTTKI